MQNFINKMEQKFGRYAIPNLINYFLIAYIASSVLTMVNPTFYYNFLALDFGKIMSGQVWRLITFILAPASLNGSYSVSVLGIVSNAVNIFFFIITINLYYLFGHSLENVWGAFKFNLYFFGGIILTILAELVVFLFTGSAVYLGGMNFVYQSMFLAFCTIFPEEQFLIWFVLPIKAKVLGILEGIMMVVMFFQFLGGGSYAYCAALFIAMLNFLLFFYLYKGLSRFSPRQQKRRKDFQRQTIRPQGVTKHKCAICGRTEVTNPELSFRFCSKCSGNYEYCEDHLFTHQHVVR